MGVSEIHHHLRYLRGMVLVGLLEYAQDLVHSQDQHLMKGDCYLAESYLVKYYYQTDLLE